MVKLGSVIIFGAFVVSRWFSWSVVFFVVLDGFLAKSNNYRWFSWFLAAFVVFNGGFLCSPAAVVVLTGNFLCSLATYEVF